MLKNDNIKNINEVKTFFYNFIYYFKKNLK